MKRHGLVALIAFFTTMLPTVKQNFNTEQRVALVYKSGFIS